LAGDVLGYMSNKPTPNEIATIVSATYGGRFFCVRFGISPRFLQEIASKDPNDMNLVWREAFDLFNKTKSSEISSAILVVALIRSAPNHLAPLSHLQIDVEDLEQGIYWHNSQLDLISGRRHAMRTGGLARDWSFGWTPMLDRFGVNISSRVSAQGLSAVKLESHEESIDKLVNIFSKKGRQNAVLIGQDGVGKTEIINAFAARILDGNNQITAELRYRQVFMMDAAALIAASRTSSLEGVVSAIFNEAFRAKNIIICFDNAHLFFEDGVGSVDISNILMPIIDGGMLRIVMAMSDQQLLRINSRNPELVNILNRVIVNPPTREETIRIMQSKSVLIEFQHSVTFMYQAIVEAYRLSERYIYDSAMPGRALSLMELSAQYGNNGLVSAESVRQSIEKTMNVKVGLVDDDERDKLANLEKLIHGRIVGQQHAVSSVSDALRRSRAGVRNQNRPIGTFLFMGPTGVGKTELAKSLASIYFGGEDSIIRLDMNEFSGPNDNARLIEDGAVNSNSLTAMVMKRPFSVVLLDEIEKANRTTILSLLQMLDEGILRDINNREVSFRDTIIIATSNAGADRIREYIDRGCDISQFEEQFMDELIDSKIFKPEFLNRFDEIVMFKPLSRDELIGVANIIIDNINKTLEPQKISVVLDHEVKKYLIEKAYDPKHGARPIRRVIQRTIENIIAKKMLSGEVQSGDVIRIDLEQINQSKELSSRLEKVTSVKEN
jgi:ATP-dependent Clp protease ATP-binding subunit ClpC